MAKKKHHHEEHVDESWLIPYADIMTLLLALFIVLFAQSSTDEAKFQQMSEVFREAFAGGTGVLDFNSAVPLMEAPQSPVVSSTNDGSFNKDQYEEMMDLYELQKVLDKFIEDKGLSLSLTTKLTENGLLITISDRALFSSGSAVVRKDAIDLAHDISEILEMKPPREIMISGHTDNEPISTSQFRSNWELSAVRSINFMEILLQNKVHDPANFSSIGYGEYRPIDSNTTAEGRSNNRRVEVLILPNFKVDK